MLIPGKCNVPLSQKIWKTTKFKSHQIEKIYTKYPTTSAVQDVMLYIYEYNNKGLLYSFAALLIIRKIQ